MLATTRSRKLDHSKRIQHTLNVYGKILQPEPWAQWAQNRSDDFENDVIKDCQTLMNAAILKFNKIVSDSGKFNGSTSTIQEDIIAMFSKQQRTRGTKRERNDDENDGQRTKPKVELKRPPFIKHTHEMKDGIKTDYKVGDEKVFKEKKFYFCDCPNHKDRIH